MSGSYADGQDYLIREPIYEFNNLKYGAFTSDMMTSPLIAPYMVGLGRLESIDEETLKQLADPGDAIQNSISGRINYVLDRTTQTKKVGKLGLANYCLILSETSFCHVSN